MAPGRVDALRKLADRLGSGELGADGVWLGEGLGRYLDNACTGMTWPAALGWEAAWWLAERRGRRDAALREYARRFLPAGSVRATASALATAIQRYEASQWLRDRAAGSSDGFQGAPRELLFRACIANVEDGNADMPTSLRQLERILGG